MTSNTAHDWPIVAYMERVIQDAATGEPKTLRDEWRIVDLRIDKDVEAALYSQNTGWRYGIFILQHRYVRNGVPEEWVFIDDSNVRDRALSHIDGRATAIDPDLVRVQEARAEDERRWQKEREMAAVERAQQESKAARKAASEAAFHRMLNSKNARNVALAQRWVATLTELKTIPGFVARAFHHEAFVALHSAVLDTVTVPTKIKAMKAFFAALPQYREEILKEVDERLCSVEMKTVLIKQWTDARREQ